MEEHFLKDFVSGYERPSTKSEPWYNAPGDCIIYQMVAEATVADRIDHILTIYKSAITGKAIGYEIKGIVALAKKYGWTGIMVESEEDVQQITKVSLSAMLLAAYEQGPQTIGRRRAYASALESFARTPTLNVSDLEEVLI